MRFIIVPLLSAILLSHNISAELPCLKPVKSSFKVYSLHDGTTQCQIENNLKTSLKKHGFTKVMCPFGVLMVATERYPDELLKYGANIVANLIDLDNDGKPDHEATVKILAHKGRSGKGFALVCGTSQEEEQREENLGHHLDNTFSCQTWKASGNHKNFKAIMFEEIFHLIHGGWALSMPEQFGHESFQSSIVCRETARLQCVKPGWHHPENKCPRGAPFKPGHQAASPIKPGEGDCTYPSCDCFEFHRQAATLYMGWYSLPFWYSDYMPRTRESFIKMASPEFLKMMADPKYHQPQKPLTGVYIRNQGVQGTGGSTTGLCKKNCICDGESGGGGGGQNGEEICEGHGYGSKKCDSIGCCNFSNNQCWSSVGQDECDGSGSGGKNGEEICEGHGYGSKKCDSIGCCNFSNNQCWSSVGQDECGGSGGGGKSTEIEHVWGVNTNDDIFYRSGYSGRWIHVPGKLVEISVSGDGNHVWGVNSNHDIFYRAGHSGRWIHVGGKLTEISVSGDGKHIWGVNSNHDIFYRAGYSGRWIHVPGKLVEISVCGDGSDVWGVNTNDDIFYRAGYSGKWIHVPGKLVDIAVGCSWGI